MKGEESVRFVGGDGETLLFDRISLDFGVIFSGVGPNARLLLLSCFSQVLFPSFLAIDICFG